MTGRGRHKQPGYIINNPLKKNLCGRKHDYHFLRLMVPDSEIFKSMELLA